MTLALQVAALLGAFAGAALIAELAGAKSLGIALGIGQVAFVLALLYVLIRR